MEKIKMHPVVSSNIKAAGYDKNSKILRIVFENGTIYEYNGVPRAHYDGIFTSESPGQYFRKFVIKGKYKFNKVNQ